MAMVAQAVSLRRNLTDCLTFLSNQKWNDCRNSLSVLFELLSERFAQELLFAAHPNHSANRVQYDRYKQPTPMTNCQTSCQQHAEHSRIDWIADETIRPFCHQFVSFDQAGSKTPLFAECSNRRRNKPHRS